MGGGTGAASRRAGVLSGGREEIVLPVGADGFCGFGRWMGFGFSSSELLSFSQSRASSSGWDIPPILPESPDTLVETSSAREPRRIASEGPGQVLGQLDAQLLLGGELQ